MLSSFEHENASIQYYGFSLACLLVALIAFGKIKLVPEKCIVPYKHLTPQLTSLFFFLGRIYLGMHSVIDIIAGLAIGVLILGLWLTVNEKIDDFITSKQNGKHHCSGFHKCFYLQTLNNR